MTLFSSARKVLRPLAALNLECFRFKTNNVNAGLYFCHINVTPSSPTFCFPFSAINERTQTPYFPRR